MLCPRRVRRGAGGVVRPHDITGNESRSLRGRTQRSEFRGERFRARWGLVGQTRSLRRVFGGAERGAAAYWNDGQSRDWDWDRGRRRASGAKPPSPAHPANSRSMGCVRTLLVTLRRKSMRLASLIVPPACGILALLPASDAAAQGGGERRSGWVRRRRASGPTRRRRFEQTGFKPRSALLSDGLPASMRTRGPEFPGLPLDLYDLDSAAGAMFELSVGYVLQRARLELSFGQRRNDVDQIVPQRHHLRRHGARGSGLDSTVASNTTSSIDNLTVRTLAVNAYYDFRNASTGFSPYLGAGVGPAFVGVRGVRFSDEYFDTAGNGAVYDPPLSSYNARLDDDYADTVLAGHLHAGADFGVSERKCAGREAHLFDALGRRVHGHVRPACGPAFRSGLLPHRYVHRPALLRRCSLTVRYVLGG